MTTVEERHGTVHGTPIPIQDAIEAFSDTGDPARQALYAFAIAMRYQQTGNTDEARRWGQVAQRGYAALDIQTDADAADHPPLIFGVSIPNLMHEGVVTQRLGLA
jgi:hypothetical protein